MVNNYFYVLLDLVYYYLVDDFCISLYNRQWSVVFFFPSSLVTFTYFFACLVIFDWVLAILYAVL